MKKVLIAQDIHGLLESGDTFLSRKDISVFVAATNDELLGLHRAQRRRAACPFRRGGRGRAHE